MIAMQTTIPIITKVRGKGWSKQWTFVNHTHMLFIVSIFSLIKHPSAYLSLLISFSWSLQGLSFAVFLLFYNCVFLLFFFFMNSVSSFTTLFLPFKSVSFPSPPSASYPVCDVGDNVSRFFFFLPSPRRILGGRTRANTNTNRLLSCTQWGKCRQMSGFCWKLLSGLSFCIYFRGEIIDDWRPAHNAF